MGGPAMAPHTTQRSGTPGEAGVPLCDGGFRSGFTPMMNASALSPGAMKYVVVGRERVLVANVERVFYALRDVFGYQGAPLSTGTLVGYDIECPLHFACFDARTGKLLNGPVSADVPSYQVRVEGDTVYVKR